MSQRAKQRGLHWKSEARGSLEALRQVCRPAVSVVSPEAEPNGPTRLYLEKSHRATVESRPLEINSQGLLGRKATEAQTLPCAARMVL
jgi:hypothetical protein